MPSLPPPYHQRPATTPDVPAIHALVTTCEQHLYGHAETDLDTIAAELARPGLDLALGTLLVHDPAGTLVARAWVNRRSAIDVHPDHRERGLGGALLAWAEARAREVGTPRIVQTMWTHSDTGALSLYEKVGMTVRRSSTVHAKDLVTRA